MNHSERPLHQALTWAELWPSVRAGLWVVALFALGLWLARRYAVPIQELLGLHAAAGVALFIATSAVAVLMPLLTNLPLVPFAVLAWGPWWTAALLLLGWVVGSMLAFGFGRHARAPILKYFPAVQRHADIDRLVHPQHRVASLILLRMTFPVDVLSYALGLFSRSTSMAENTLSTALGAAPFALLFALFPVLPDAVQALVFASSALVFVLYALWILRRPQAPAEP